MQQKKEGITMKYSNYKNPYTKNGKIYSSSDIYNMKLGEAYSRKKELFAQKRSIGIPTDSELAQSDNVVWVNEYTRSDGTHVRGHWRAKPGQGQTNSISQESWNENLSQEQTQEDELSEIDLDNPAQTAATATLKLLGVFLDGTEIGEILYILTPLIQFIINKWLGEDDSEIAEFDYSKENDEQIPWENAQPFKPDENPFLAEPEKQKEEKDDSLTGGASSVDNNTYTEIYAVKTDGIRLKQDVNVSPLQEKVIDYNNKKNANYKDARDLLNISIIKTQNLENTDEYSVLSKEQVTARSKDIGYNLSNGNNTVEFSPNSSIANSVNSSVFLRKSVENWAKLPVEERPRRILVTLNDNQNLFRSINNATILKPEIKNGYFTGYLYDKYDFKLQKFDDWEIFKANTGAVALQNTGVLENYNIIVPIKIKL